MFSIKPIFSNAGAAQLEAQWQAMNTLSNQLLQGAQQLIALNMSTGKAALEQAAASAKQFLGAKDGKEFLALSTSQSQPGLINFITYGRQMCAIAATAQAQLMRASRPVSTPAPSPPTAELKAIERVAAAPNETKAALKATLAAPPPVALKAAPLRSVKSAHRAKPAAALTLATPRTNATGLMSAPSAAKLAGVMVKQDKSKGRSKK